MPANPATADLRERLEGFVHYRHEHVRGDEKGEAQIFLDRLFIALGHGGAREAGAVLEERIHRNDVGGTAFADLVWKPRVLIEMKRAGVDLSRHYRQAFDYWMRLVPDRPRYVVLCNFDEFWIYDLNVQIEDPLDKILIDDLPRRWEALAFMLPVEQRTVFRNDQVAVTRDAAATVSHVFNRLIERGVDRQDAQRFILQAVMAMFAEDIGMLPRHHFGLAVQDCLEGASAFDLLFGLFREMNLPGATAGGRFEGTPYFNGGLFQEVTPFDINQAEIESLSAAATFDWSQVRPAIFGTLFEQSLEKEERHAYGAHFTSEVDIQKIVLPSIVRPWQERIDAASTIAELRAIEHDLLQYRVLDPACGCGNFLYIAYRELRRLEHQLQEKVVSRQRAAGAEDVMALAFVSTTQFFGLDIRPFAVAIAKVTLMLARKLAADELGDERTVLPLDDLDDNILTGDSLVMDWPAFDVCVGNPPYLGRNRIAPARGAEYASWLLEKFPDVEGRSDYVSYFFRKAHDLLDPGQRAGLVGTDAVKHGYTRRASLDYIVENGGVIYDAVASQPWSGDAAVNVSIVNWVKNADVQPRVLWLSNGNVKIELKEIPPSLSPEIDVADAEQITVNRGPKRCFQGQTPGVTRGGRGFVITQSVAEDIVERDPRSAEVIYPFLGGRELDTDGQPKRFIVDIPSADVLEAARWPGALSYVRDNILPERERKAREQEADNERIRDAHPGRAIRSHHIGFYRRWWQLSYRREDMLEAVSKLSRYIAISRHATETRQSVYAFVSNAIRPGDALQVFAFEDDYSFGVLHSTHHRRWFEERCTRLRRKAMRYVSEDVWDTFPWPQAPTDETAGAIVDVVVRLLALRDEHVAAGMPLARQYDSLSDPGANPLRDLQEELDDAVARAYGFTRDEDPLSQLFALNASIAAEERQGVTAPRPPGNAGLSGTMLTSSRIEPPVRL